MAETVTCAVLMLNFGFPRYLDAQRRHQWAPHAWSSLSGKTALVIGLGGIGARVAASLKFFSTTVIGMRHSKKSCAHIDELAAMTDLPNVLPRADFVCIHVPNTAATRHLVTAEFLARMKPAAYLINTARGSQVDEVALIGALRGGAIAGAYLDVFAQEPLPADSPLWDLPNLIMSPHMGDAAAGWENNAARFFADNLECFLRGKPLQNVCDPTKGY